MTKLYEEYLGELFGYENSPELKKISNYLFEKERILMDQVESSCMRKKFKDRKLLEICRRQGWIKVYSILSNYVKRNQSKCNNNKRCLNTLKNDFIRYQEDIKNASEEIIKIKNSLK